MVQVQLTGGKNPQENPQGFISHLKKQYPGISTSDIQAMYARAVMLYQPPAGNVSVMLLGADILSNDVESLPWWKLLSLPYRRMILDHPIDTGLAVDGVGDVKKVLQTATASRSGVHRKSLISLPGLQNSYVWCKMNTWIQDVDPQDLDTILRHKGDKAKNFVRRIRVIDDHGPYAYVRPYGAFQVEERYPARTVDDIRALFRDQSRKDLFHGFDAIKE